MILDIGQTDEEAPPRSQWSRTRHQPTLPSAPSTFHVSTRPCFGYGPRCSLLRSVFGQCLPHADSNGQAVGRNTYRGLGFPAAYGSPPFSTATEPRHLLSWPYFLYEGAYLAATTVYGGSRLRCHAASVAHTGDRPS